MSQLFPSSDHTPTAEKYSRGWLAVVFGATGVADALKWIRRKADGTFDVVEVASGTHTHAESDVTSLVADLALKAPLASPTFTGAVVVPTINTPVVGSLAQSASDAANTASTVTYSDAATLALTLPTGTWSVTAVGGLSLLNLGGNSDLRIDINGTAGAAQTLDATIEEMFVDNAVVAGISGGGSINIKVQFKSNAAGTTNARNPWLMVIATRTA